MERSAVDHLILILLGNALISGQNDLYVAVLRDQGLGKRVHDVAESACLYKRIALGSDKGDASSGLGHVGFRGRFLNCRCLFAGFHDCRSFLCSRSLLCLDFLDRWSLLCLDFLDRRSCLCLHFFDNRSCLCLDFLDNSCLHFFSCGRLRLLGRCLSGPGSLFRRSLLGIRFFSSLLRSGLLSRRLLGCCFLHFLRSLILLFSCSLLCCGLFSRRLFGCLGSFSLLGDRRFLDLFHCLILRHFHLLKISV